MRARASLRIGAAALSIAATGLLAGCGSTGHVRPEVVMDRQGVDVVAADSSRQFTYFKDRSGTERYCRGPTPDAMTTLSDAVHRNAKIEKR